MKNDCHCHCQSFQRRVIWWYLDAFIFDFKNMIVIANYFKDVKYKLSQFLWWYFDY
jgi:hypothetical protein